jgi:8-oxo-dGTP pyrophosphatase MutT (NUDIX family)
MEFPRIISRKTTILSPWVTVIEREVCFLEGSGIEIYHSLSQAAYVAVFAVTDDGRIPIIRQYRPAVEAHTWEFPAGTVDAEENPVTAAARELREETGLRADELHEIGAYHPDTGRLSIRSTGFFAVCRTQIPDHPLEQELEVQYVSLDTLFDMVRSGDFRHQLHIALIASALLHGHISLPA